MRLVTRPISVLGGATIRWLEFIGGHGYLLRDTAAAIPDALLEKRGRRLGWANLWAQMVRVGVNSIPIVSLVVFCIGAILALQMAPILKDYGATAQVADIISIAMFRELGPLVAAIVLTGFAGASIAAEIGTMVVSEEIEAMQASAISPIRFLVVPRVLATTVMMVCLAVVADLMGVLGGLITSRAFLGISVRQYLQHTFEIAQVKDFVTGLIKAGVFGTIISSLACYLGLRVSGGAQGVGVATTRTVVLTIVALITVDLMFTAVFFYLEL
ncbi:MlaE family ABC transporter permease [Fontivita pretiosa]|uniref:MlaE family ABC transporter permease n=1 Tax=Fontivita pretiosa TaxID=2989684 RepID=UPI003D17A85E